MTNALRLAGLTGGGAVSAGGAAALAAAPTPVVVGAALLPIAVLVLGWIFTLLGRELFARKSADVRRDLLAFVALERADRPRQAPKPPAPGQDGAAGAA